MSEVFGRVYGNAVATDQIRSYCVLPFVKGPSIRFVAGTVIVLARYRHDNGHNFGRRRAAFVIRVIMIPNSLSPTKQMIFPVVFA